MLIHLQGLFHPFQILSWPFVERQHHWKHPIQFSEEDHIPDLVVWVANFLEGHHIEERMVRQVLHTGRLEEDIAVVEGHRS